MQPPFALYHQFKVLTIESVNAHSGEFESRVGIWSGTNLWFEYRAQ